MPYEHIQGAEELERRLLELPAKLEGRVMRGAMRAGAVVFRDIANSEVPRRKGKLAKALRISTRSRRGLIVASVKIGGGEAFYAHMVHGGVKPHKIGPRRGSRGLFFLGIFVRQVRHPGFKANPFMTRTFNRGVPAAIDAVADYIRKRLDQAVK